MLREQNQPEYLKQFEYYCRCPISLQLMQEPVTLTCGHSFQSASLQDWRQKASCCPICKKEIKADEDTKRLDFNMKRACAVYREELGRCKKQPSKRFQVFVRSDKTATVEVGDSDSVESLMIKFSLKRNFNTLTQSFPPVLHFAGKKLQPGLALNDYGIQPHSTLQCYY